MTTFKDISLSQETFDFINPATPGQNSFFERCYKIGPRTYRCLDDEAHKLYGVMRVGSVKAEVFNVRG